MKKIILSTIVMIAFIFSTFAQTQVLKYEKSEIAEKVNLDLKPGINHLKAMNSKAQKSRWYNYGITMNNALSNISILNGHYLFPDSTIQVIYTSGPGTPSFHILGDVLDPKSEWFNDPFNYPGELFINNYMPYTVDSVGVQFYYDRFHPDPTIVDTLIIEVWSNNTASDLPIYMFTGMSAEFGEDTVRFAALQFNAGDLSSKAVNKYTYTVLLTQAFANDTLDDGTVMAYVNTSNIPQVNAGRLVASTVKFIPGYTWIPNVDTLTSKNRVLFLSYEEQGEETYPSYAKGDYNCSSIATKRQSMDPTNPQGWFEFQVPKYAWDNTWGFENHLIYYKLTAEESYVNQPQGNIITLSQNQPNPFNNVTSINYNLSEAADVTFDLFDQTGRKVMSINKGVEIPGIQTIEVDAANLTNGIYFYTLTAGNYKASKKMVVLK